jgi:hypothetical protein
MLTKTMMQVKQDLKDMKTYVEANCKSARASIALIKVIAVNQQEVLDIDQHIVKNEYLSAFNKIAAHVMPRAKDFYIRRNYDYGEFWPAALDAFREGKVKDVVEMSRGLRRWPDSNKPEQNVSNDNQEHIDTKVDNPDKDKKKKVNRAYLLTLSTDDSALHLDSYCDRESNKEYWSQARDDDEDFNQAVDDFLKYIEEVKC